MKSMWISNSTMLALAQHLASRYPYTVHKIFSEANSIKKDYSNILELEKGLVTHLDLLMLRGY